MGTTVTVSSRDGLNLLKAARMAAAVRRMRSVVFIKSGERVAGARNVLGVLALCAALGTPVEVEAYGSDEGLAARTVEEILADPGDPKNPNVNGLAVV